MLSILIPIYNYDVTQLVTQLHQQATATHQPFEIITIEDGSVKHIAENDLLRDLPNVTHIVREKNIGRSAIRNQLADMAQYDYLLFIDCDAKITNPNYIKNYLQAAQPETTLYGSITYPPDADTQHSLRLKYGLHNESSATRAHFTTFHFLISRQLFQTIRFDECIVRYGHEDLVFRHTLRQKGVPLLRINNELMHCGIDTNATYLNKIKDSCKNLYDIHASGKYPHLQNDSKLLATYIKMQQRHLTKLCATCFWLLEKPLRWQLSSHNPSLHLFQLYKIGCMCQYAQQAQRQHDKNN